MLRVYARRCVEQEEYRGQKNLCRSSYAPLFPVFASHCRPSTPVRKVKMPERKSAKGWHVLRPGYPYVKMESLIIFQQITSDLRSRKGESQASQTPRRDCANCSRNRACLVRTTDTLIGLYLPVYCTFFRCWSGWGSQLGKVKEDG